MHVSSRGSIPNSGLIDNLEILTPFRTDNPPAPMPNLETISMPQLSFDKLDRLPEVMNTDTQLQWQLGSQGQFISFDKSYAYSHESTHPDIYFRKGLGLPCVVNMDRGGIVTRPDGTHAACIADGVSGDGYFSAFVAQGICQYVMNALSQKSAGFGNEEMMNKAVVNQLFEGSFQSLQNLQNCHLDGSSTLLFAECLPTNQNRTYKVCVGALGDGAAIHINSKKKKALQINTIHRELDSSGMPNTTSTGGGICVSGGMWNSQFIEAKVIDIDEDDYIILVTDGFLDNVRDNRISEMVELVAYHPFFDEPLDQLLHYNRFWETASNPTMPTVENMKSFIDINNDTVMAPDQKLTAETITQRLAAYTTLVTYGYRIKEEKHYKDQCSLSFNRNTPKTDDAMIITMSPIARNSS